MLDPAGRPLAVLSIWGPAGRVTDSRFEALGAIARDAAHSIAHPDSQRPAPTTCPLCAARCSSTPGVDRGAVHNVGRAGSAAQSWVSVVTLRRAGASSGVCGARSTRTRSMVPVKALRTGR